MIERFVSAQLDSNKAWRDRLVNVESGAGEDRWAGLAMDVSFPAAIKPGPLSDLAAGAFDLAFVVIFIMPLLMIVLSYDVLSDDRESGRLGLLLSQPISIRQLVTARLKVRFGAVGTIVLITSLIGLFAGSAGDSISARLPYMGVWLLISASYFLVWAAVIIWAISLNIKGETTALLLAGLWIANGLVGPASVSAAAESLYPTPSRLAFLSEAREASSAAYKTQADIMQGMLLDHPDLTAENYSIPEYIRTAFLVNKTVDEAVVPVLARFDEVQAERRQFLAKLQYVSPAVLTLQLFNLAAGTNLERHLTFEQQVRDFKQSIAEEVEGNVLAGERLKLAEYDRLPQFSHALPTLGEVITRAAIPICFLIALSIFIGSIAFRNLSKLQTRIRES
jgi:ABC-2 type transport system permease protein